MEPAELRKIFANFLDSSKFTAELYLVFKNEEEDDTYFTLKTTQLSDDLIEDLKSTFSACFEERNNEHLVLKDVYQTNHNSDEENELYTDDIENNGKANELFNSITNQLDSFDHGQDSYDDIYGFIIELDDGHNKIKLFQKKHLSNIIKKGNSFIFFFDEENNQLKKENKEFLKIHNRVDLLELNQELVIFNKKVYEANFNFNERLKHLAEQKYDLLQQRTHHVFYFEDVAHETVRGFSKKDLKKLQKISEENPFIRDRIVNHIPYHVYNYERHQFKTNDDGRHKIKSKKDLEILVRALNEDYNKNELTENKFKVYSKDKL